MPVSNDLVIELRDIFATQFSLDEMADLAQELGVDLEDVSGGTRKAKARELASYLSRHDLVGQLAEVGPEARPDIDWLGLLQRHGVATVPAVVAPQQVAHTDLQELQFILALRPMFMTPEGRAATLSLAGVRELVSADLNGNGQLVAGSVLDQLNRYGTIAPGDTALGRLLAYLCLDPALPPDQKQAIEAIITRYELTTGSD